MVFGGACCSVPAHKSGTDIKTWIMEEFDTEIIHLRRRNIRLWTAALVLLVIVLVAVRTRITSVTVKGNKTYTDQQAVDLVFQSYWDSNTALCIFNDLTGRKKTIPFVSDYEISLTGPFSCVLIVYEKNPVGCIKYLDSYMYFDQDGIMIESSVERLKDIPVVKGISFGHIVLGRELPVEDKEIFSDVMNVTQQFSQFGIGCDTIEFDQFRNITAELTGGDIVVELGTNVDISAKISVLNDMLPGLKERELKGTLDLSGYRDTDRNKSISFSVRREDTD